MFVLDASVLPGWLFPDEVNTYTEAVLDRLRQTGAVVPEIWPLEITNVLLVGERRNRLTETQTVQFLRFLQSLPIRQAGGSSLAGMSSVLAVARQQNLSAYDASYLELAMREGLPLATEDDRLRASAQRVGVPLLQ